MRGRSLKEAIIFLLLCKNNRRNPGTGKLENLSRWTSSLIKEGKTYLQNKQREKLDKYHVEFLSEKKRRCRIKSSQTMTKTLQKDMLTKCETVKSNISRQAKRN